MKKFLIFMIACSFIMAGCSNSDLITEQNKVHENFRESLINNGELVSKNIPFSYALEVEEKNGSYVYTVKIDNPLVVMNSVQVLVLNPDELTNEYESSSLGIYTEQPIYMVPNQENEVDGYYSHLSIDGVSVNASFRLYVLVSFQDEYQLSREEYYFSFNVVDGENVKEIVNE